MSFCSRRIPLKLILLLLIASTITEYCYCPSSDQNRPPCSKAPNATFQSTIFRALRRACAPRLAMASRLADSFLRLLAGTAGVLAFRLLVAVHVGYMPGLCRLDDT